MAKQKATLDHEFIAPKFSLREKSLFMIDAGAPWDEDAYLKKPDYKPFIKSLLLSSTCLISGLCIMKVADIPALEHSIKSFSHFIQPFDPKKATEIISSSLRTLGVLTSFATLPAMIFLNEHLQQKTVFKSLGGEKTFEEYKNKNPELFREHIEYYSEDRANNPKTILQFAKAISAAFSSKNNAKE